MSVFKNKRALALVLAVVMAVSVFAVSAYAVTTQQNPLPIDYYDQLWYLDTGLDPYTDQWIDIFGSEYGHDTIQELVYNEGADELILVLHPQYYHEDDINWEEPEDISGVLTIFDIEFWDETANQGNGGWVGGLLYGGAAFVPADYLFRNGGESGTEYYYKCKLTVAYTDSNGDVDVFSPPNDGVAYLYIPSELFF
jgi:hypothetical protein